MRTSTTTGMRAAMAAAIGLGLAACARADAPKPAARPEVTLLLQGGADVLGRPLAYPAGTPQVTAAVVTLPPGAETGWHSHAVPLYGQVLEGTLTVDYGARGERVLPAGASILEAMDWPHNGRNDGSTAVRILVVYMGAEGVPNTEAAD
ncbi:cupin domain-containing protein [Limibaculum sp. FT325]|uniref:cupin domain-containing protein n=1 Tax=Thermohalobaculum sediminis TaxID=2939436 RepID=UPI0020BE03D7|nr:cupin domain-containing protein [Limibaculum sediminis]MCL5776216.1 cupin domain-containing protein [Limibaculum sediminis]